MGRIKHITERTIETIKNEGILSFGKKAVDYILLRTVARKKYYKAYGDVLFINGCALPHPSRYRVDHQIEQLMSSGMHAEKVFYENLSLDYIKLFRCFVFFRCPITDTIKEFIKIAKENNKVVFYDIDDLVFDKKYTDNVEFVKNLEGSAKKLYDDGVNRMGETLKLCDYAITTTERLQQELKKYVKDVYINRNVASDRMVELSLNAYKNRKEHDGIIMGYLSGSITHNPDVELIKPVLIKIMKKYQNVKLKLVGEISIPEEFKEFKDRIIIEPFMDWEKLPKLISSIDINLAPLENTIFNEAKSENKWLEASLCHVVTVASDVGAFHNCIKNGIDGYLCNSKEEWENVLHELIEDDSLRQKIGNTAYERVIKENTTIYSGHGVAKFIKSKLNKNIAFVLPSTNVSGGVNVISRHIAILKKQKYDVFIINMDNDDNDLKTKWGTVGVIKKHKTKMAGNIDTAVASLWTTLYYIKKLPNVKNKAYLVQGFETDFASAGKYMRVEANATYEDETGVRYLTISKWCQGWLEKRFERDVKYAPNGIDLNQFQFKEREFKGKIKILVEGNPEDYYKNVDESFRIVEKLDKNKYEIQFLSYKGNPKKWYYIDKFLHKVPYEEVYKIYQNADILIKSSILESFSYPPLEMMATGGLVVIAPNEGNIEFIRDEENCLFYKTGDIDSAVTQIERLRIDNKLRDKLIAGGIKTAKSREWSNIEKEIVDLYE